MITRNGRQWSTEVSRRHKRQSRTRKKKGVPRTTRSAFFLCSASGAGRGLVVLLGFVRQRVADAVPFDFTTQSILGDRQFTAGRHLAPAVAFQAEDDRLFFD